jgi:hypothetical protein
MGLPPEQEAHMGAVLKGAHLLESGADPLETGLLCSLLRASPEVKRLLEWSCSARPPSGVVPLHAAAFAILGAVYFHARLVRYDPALSSRAVDDYGVEVRGTKDLRINFTKFLVELAREKNSLVGFLATREFSDTNSVVHMHVLGGMLAPLFSEISREARSRKQTWLGKTVSNFLADSLPSHLSDVVILEALQSGHVSLLRALSEARKDQDFKDSFEAAEATRKAEAERAEKAEEQKRTDNEAKRKKDEQTAREAAAAREKTERDNRQARLEAVTQNLQALFSAFSEDRTCEVTSQRFRDAASTVLRASWDIISQTKEVTDEALYVVLDNLPRGTGLKAPRILDRAVKATNEFLYRDNRSQLTSSQEESLSIGVIYETLARVSQIKDPERFSKLPSELVRYIAANPDYPPQLLADLRRAFLGLHSQKSLELAPK